MAGLGRSELRGVRGYHAALAAVFRAVEGVICALEEGDAVVVGAQLGDPGGDEEGACLAHRARRDRLLDPTVELVGVLDGRLRNDHGELVAAHAAGDVGRPDPRPNTL